MISLARVGIAVAVAVLVGLVYFHRGSIDQEAISAWIASLGWLGAVAFVLLFALGTVAFLPGSILALVGGALFGPVWGTALNLLGATLGASLSFLFARFAAGPWVQRQAGSRMHQLIEGVDKQGWRFVAFIRLVPVFPFNLSKVKQTQSNLA